MTTHIALLRGINVSGQKKILMADLRALFEVLGFSNVRTYIQSGNVIFQTSETKNLSEKISEAIKERYGWDVPVLVKTSTELQSILKASPFNSEKLKQSYFTLLSEAPSEENINQIKDLDYPNEEFHIIKNCVYLFYKNGAGRAKLGANLIERKLEVNATARNYRTLTKLIELANQL